MKRTPWKSRWARPGAAIACIGALAFLAVPAGADSVYGTAVAEDDWTGSRVYDVGLLLFTGDGGPNGDPTLSWDISFDGSKYYYVYTFTGFQPDVSHFTFDLTDSFAYAGSGAIIGDSVELTIGGNTSTVLVEYSDGTSQMVGVANVQIEADDETDFTVAFYSYNSPVWHDIYIKDGKFYTLTNLNYLNHIDGDTTAGYVPTPNSRVVVPVPPALGIGLLGMGMLGVMRARNRRAA